MGENAAFIRVSGSRQSEVKMDGATFVTNSSQFDIVSVNKSSGAKISARNLTVVAEASQGADVCVANVNNSKDTTVIQDDTNVNGAFHNVTMARVDSSIGTTISQRNVKLEATPSLTGNRLPGGTLRINEIHDSHGTNIDQTGMRVSGPFHGGVRVNEVSSSTGTTIKQGDIEIDVEERDSSSESEDEAREEVGRTTGPPTADNWQTKTAGSDKELPKQLSESKPVAPSSDSVPDSQSTASSAAKENSSNFDKDGLPKRNTREYYKAPKFTFNVKLVGGGNITMTRLRDDRVRNVIAFIKEKHPPSRARSFLLQCEDQTVKSISKNPEDTLTEAGFEDELELITVDC